MGGPPQWEEFLVLGCSFVTSGCSFERIFLGLKMRPRGLVQSVFLLNTTENNGNWIPMKININSWIILMPRKTGGHTEDVLKHDGTSSVGAYKAKVVETQNECWSCFICVYTTCIYVVPA